MLGPSSTDWMNMDWNAKQPKVAADSWWMLPILSNITHINLNKSYQSLATRTWNLFPVVRCLPNCWRFHLIHEQQYSENYHEWKYFCSTCSWVHFWFPWTAGVTSPETRNRDALCFTESETLQMAREARRTTGRPCRSATLHGWWWSSLVVLGISSQLDGPEEVSWDEARRMSKVPANATINH